MKCFLLVFPFLAVLANRGLGFALVPNRVVAVLPRVRVALSLSAADDNKPNTVNSIPPQLSPRKGFNVLEKSPFGQQLLVKVARWGWKFIFNRLLVELAPQDKQGAYTRTGYNINNGYLGDDVYPAESGRYHIYVGNPCPWCQRVSLAHSLYKLGDNNKVTISYAADDPTRARRGGWAFDSPDSPAVNSEEGEEGGPAKNSKNKDNVKNNVDPIWGAPDLLAVYSRLTARERLIALIDSGDQTQTQSEREEDRDRDIGFVGRCTLPLLVDTKSQTIVSNESKDIVRMLRAMSSDVDLVAADKDTSEANELAKYVYEKLNNGVYRCGFASKQGAYDAAVKDVFEGLDRLDGILSTSTFLLGDTVSEVDVFLLPTAVRFDSIYHTFFKCGLTTINASYKNIARWMADMHRVPGVRQTFDLDDAKRSYYDQLFPLNPSGIIAATPEKPFRDMLANAVESDEWSLSVLERKVKK